MGTQGPGRKRIPNQEKLTAEDDALNQIAREAEARLAAKRAARAEAREIRMKELERQQKEMSDDEEKMSVGSRGSLRVEERPDRDFVEKGSRTASTLSAATLASLGGGASSRRGSCDTSFSVETEASIRDMKESLAEMEEKYRKAMVSNAQLHNEKSTLMYSVESLKEELSDMEEALWESRRHCDHGNKELERERQAHSVLQFQFKEMEETLRQTEDLLTKHGVTVVSPEVSNNGEAGQDAVIADSASRLAQEPSPGGRESMLGKVRERQPAEGSKIPQDNMKYSRCQLYKRSLSLNVISKPHSECGATLSVASNRGVVMTDMERPLDNQICKIQTNLGGTQVLIHQSVSPVCSTEKVLKSRLVPPQCVKDIILDNKVMVSSIVAADKLNSLSHEKQKQHVVRNETPSSNRDAAQKSSSVVDHIFHNQEKDGNACRDVSCSEGEVVPDIPALGANKNRLNEYRTPTSVDSLKENEFVNKLVEIDGDECDGQSFEDEDTEILTDSEENQTVVSMGKASQSLVHQQQAVSGNLGRTRSEEKSFKNEADLSSFGVSYAQRLVAKVKSELDAFLSAEGTIIGGKCGTPEKLENWRIHEEEPIREAVKNQEKTQDNSSERPECSEQTETSTPFVPTEMWKDCLEKAIQSMLRGFIENQGFVAEIPVIYPEVPESLNLWISGYKEMLKSITEIVSEQRDAVDQMMGIKLTAEDELPLKDLPSISDDPESVEQIAAGHSTIIEDCSFSEMLEVTSLKVHPQTAAVSMDLRKVCKDIQEEATENPSGGMGICNFKVESTEFSPGEMPGMNSVDTEKGNRSQKIDIDPKVTSWSEEFVFVEFYFGEPAKTKPAPVKEVVETQLKRHQTLSTNSQSSKVRRLIEITADEIKAMAVPELVLMSLREGRIIEDQHIDKSAGSNTEEQEEFSAEDMDSCEEVDEEAAQQPAIQQPETEHVIIEDVKVVSVASSAKRIGFDISSRKYKHKTDCKIS